MSSVADKLDKAHKHGAAALGQLCIMLVRRRINMAQVGIIRAGMAEALRLFDEALAEVKGPGDGGPA